MGSVDVIKLFLCITLLRVCLTKSQPDHPEELQLLAEDPNGHLQPKEQFNVDEEFFSAGENQAESQKEFADDSSDQNLEATGLDDADQEVNNPDYYSEEADNNVGDRDSEVDESREVSTNQGEVVDETTENDNPGVSLGFDNSNIPLDAEDLSSIAVEAIDLTNRLRETVDAIEAEVPNVSPENGNEVRDSSNLPSPDVDLVLINDRPSFTGPDIDESADDVPTVAVPDNDVPTYAVPGNDVPTDVSLTDSILPDVPEDTDDKDLPDGYEVPIECKKVNVTEVRAVCVTEAVDVCLVRQEEECKRKCKPVCQKVNVTVTHEVTENECQEVLEFVCEAEPAEECEIVEETECEDVTVTVDEPYLDQECEDVVKDNCTDIFEPVCTNTTVPEVTFTEETYCEPHTQEVCTDVWKKSCWKEPKNTCKKIWVDEMVWVTSDQCADDSLWAAKKSLWPIWKKKFHKRAADNHVQKRSPKLNKIGLIKSKLSKKLTFARPVFIRHKRDGQVHLQNNFHQSGLHGFNRVPFNSHGFHNSPGFSNTGSIHGAGQGLFSSHGSFGLTSPIIRHKRDGQVHQTGFHGFNNRPGFFGTGLHSSTGSFHGAGHRPFVSQGSLGFGHLNGVLHRKRSTRSLGLHKSKCWPTKQWKTVPRWKMVCEKVWSEECKDVWVPDCKHIKKDKCQPISVRTTRNKVKETCKEVPKQVCEKYTDQVCKDVEKTKPVNKVESKCAPVQRESCSTVNKEICEEKPREVCKDVTRVVEEVVEENQCSVKTPQCNSAQDPTCASSCTTLCIDQASNECERAPVTTCHDEQVIISVCS